MMRIKKICGLTNPLDVRQAVQWGANAVGFVLYPQSPRYVSAQQIRHCTEHIDSHVLRVGVFVNPALATQAENNAAEALCDLAAAAGLTVVQLHGKESPAFCRRVRQRFTVWKTLSTAVSEEPSSGQQSIAHFEDSVDAFLIDHQLPQAGLWGGTGKTCSWTQAAELVTRSPRPVILAGGLHSGNVRAACQHVHPAGVDASSRLEKAPGKKDPQAVRAFLNTLASISLPKGHLQS